MIIEPKVRGFICTTAHPEGCAQNVREQIDFVRAQTKLKGPKNVLIIGCSTGYGLASRIAASYGANAATLGVMFEKPTSGKRTASAGWYNTAAFETFTAADGIYAKTINGDAFSNTIKEQTIATLKEDFKDGIDLVIYSLAAPKRTNSKTGITHSSVLKTTGKPHTEKNLNVMTGEINEITVEPANQEEIDDTIKVMGGEDWELWTDALLAANVLAKGALTVAYSYVGPELTYPIYREGTIGAAKKHLEATVDNLNKKLAVIAGKAFISVNKCVVTQASSAIPIVPLYVAILYKVMKTKGNHEGCIEQIYRLFAGLYNEQPLTLDDNGFIRIDDWELAENVQAEVKEIWQQIDSSNVETISDLKGYRKEFYRLFGFDLANVDYQNDIDPERTIASLSESV